MKIFILFFLLIATIVSYSQNRLETSIITHKNNQLEILFSLEGINAGNSPIYSPEKTYLLPEYNTYIPYYTRIIYSTSPTLEIDTIIIIESEEIKTELNINTGYFNNGKTYYDNLPDRLVYLIHTYKTTDNLYAHILRYIPFSYKIETKTVTVVKSSKIEFSIPKSENYKATADSKSVLYEKETVSLKSNLQKEPEAIYIVYTDTLLPETLPYIEWKTLKGYKIYSKSIDSFQSTEEIKDTLRYYYRNHNLKYVLLVGDSEQIPPLENMGTSDASYGFLLNDDFYPEVAVGRYSVLSKLDLSNQIQKTIQYEKNSSGNWQSRAVMAGSDQGPGDNGEFDKEHLRIVKDSLSKIGIQTIAELYDGTDTIDDLDAIGDPTSTMLTQVINNGVGHFYYMGHGTNGSLTTTHYRTEHVSTLQNSVAFPISVIGGCSVGKFDNNTCLAESFMRAYNNGKPTGTVLMWAAAEDFDWNAPMRGQDEIVNQLIADNSIKTFGELAMKSMEEMNIYYDKQGFQTSSTWVIFGDPSLQIYTDSAVPTQVSHPDTIAINTTAISFIAETEGYLAISQNNSLLFSEPITSGSNNIIINQLVSFSKLHMCFSSNNKLPYIDSIPIKPALSPYIFPNQFLFKDSNENSTFESGENIKLEMTLENGGDSNSPIELSVSANSPYLQIRQNEFMINELNTGEKIRIVDFTDITINNTCPNNTIISVIVRITQEGQYWEFEKELVVKAGNLKIMETQIQPTAGSDEDSIPDAGEVINYKIKIHNSGQSSSYSEQIHLSCEDQRITILDEIKEIQEVLPHQSADISFTIFIEDSIQPSTNIALTYHSEQLDTTLYLKINPFIESWEKNHINIYDLNLSYQIPWVRDSSNSYNGKYSLKSGNTGNNEASIFSILLHCMANDSISFRLKTSCEAPYLDQSYSEWYDYLTFYLDGDSISSWAGETDWTQYTIPITMGTHTLTWKYSKDYSYKEGADAVWIDEIVFPSFKLLTDTSTYNLSLQDTIIHFDYGKNNNIIIGTFADSIHIWEIKKAEWLSYETDGHFWGLPDSKDTSTFIISYRTDNALSNQKVFFNTISTSNVFSNENWLVYYNKLNSTLQVPSEVQHIKIYTMEGKVISSATPNSNILMVHLESGKVYIVETFTKKGSKTALIPIF